MNWTQSQVDAHNARVGAKQRQYRTADFASMNIAEPELTPAAESERQLHNAIRAECSRRGWLVFSGSMAHRTHRTVGEPDMIILADGGRLFLVELKTRTGKLRPEQLAVKAWAEKLGHRVLVVRSLQQFSENVESEDT